MTEQQFTYEVKECCDRVLPDFLNLIDKKYIDNMDYTFHDGTYSWVEYSGTKLDNYDKRTLDIIGRIMRAVCNKYHIMFVNALPD